MIFLYILAHEQGHLDRKSTRLNSSHRCISYAVFCLKKKITPFMYPRVPSSTMPTYSSGVIFEHGLSSAGPQWSHPEGPEEMLSLCSTMATRTPLRAASIAAHGPAMPPPITRTSESTRFTAPYFFSYVRPPPPFTLFPYTTLFR